MPIFLKRTIWRWMFAIPAAVYMVLAVTGNPAWLPIEVPYYLFIPFLLGLTVLAWGAFRPGWWYRESRLTEETAAEKAYVAHRADAKARAITARRTSAPPIRDDVDRDAYGFPIKDKDDDDSRLAPEARDYRDGPRQGPLGYAGRALGAVTLVIVWLVAIEAVVQGAKWARERGLWYVSAPGFALIAFLIWYLLLSNRGSVRPAAGAVVVSGGSDDIVQ